ncbi:MAG: aminoglycoside phosphotransferase family protein [Flavobacteriia bacterium]|nr:MAG: aminoglycoside phosphotransferase family protein [Flavobacteriia bacterium]
MEKLKNILKNFQVPDHDFSFETISNGLINDTYLVSDKEEPKYILQRINTKIFTRFHDLIHNIELILPVLDAPGYKKIELIKTREDKPYLKTDTSNVWRVMTFIKGSTVYNTTTDPEIAKEAGRIIGLFHKLLKDFDAGQVKETLIRFHDLNLRYDQFKEARKNADKEKLEQAEKAIAFVDKNIDLLLNITFDELPVRVCHNDTKLNNILFSSDKKSLCLIDLDTIMPGTFLYDFGDAVRTIANTAPEDEIDLSKINFRMELFEAFIEGLQLNKEIFSDEEKEQMSLGAALMPFLHGIRALTDFLENNRYYKVSYEMQNLDRCMSLFTFSQLAIDRQADMKKIIKEKLN